MDNRPIGVFDSGLGGLTGVRELRRRLPHENIVYFGDTGRVPYGSRSPETILQYARQDIAFLLSKDVKCIMAACGTVSSTYPAAEAEKLPVPYLGVVDAAAREAAFSTRNRRIGVIGTAATIRSRSYEALLRRLVPGVEITARPCPLFVPLVEAGYVDHSAPDKQEITKLVIAQYLTEIRDAGVDTLILGCTHYPLIKTMIGEFMDRNVVLVDPAKTAAHHLELILSERGLKADHPAGQAHFYVSDAPDGFVQTADLFLGEYKGGRWSRSPLTNIKVKEHKTVSTAHNEDYRILIRSVSEQFEHTEPLPAEETDKIELMTYGSFLKKAGSYYISYKETETIGFAGCTTTIKIAEDGSRVALLRFGKVNTQLVIQRDYRNICYYETEVGPITLGVTGDGIACDLSEPAGGTAKFSYLLDADDPTALINRTTLEIQVEKVK